MTSEQGGKKNGRTSGAEFDKRNFPIKHIGKKRWYIPLDVIIFMHSYIAALGFSFVYAGCRKSICAQTPIVVISFNQYPLQRHSLELIKVKTGEQKSTKHCGNKTRTECIVWMQMCVGHTSNTCIPRYHKNLQLSAYLAQLQMICWKQTNRRLLCNEKYINLNFFACRKFKAWKYSWHNRGEERICKLQNTYKTKTKI